MKPGLAFAQRRPSTFCDKPGHHRVEAAELRKPFRQRPVHVQSVYRSLDVHWSQMSDVPRNINLFPLNAARSRLDETKMTTWLGAAALVAIISIPFVPMDEDALGFIKGQPGLIAQVKAGLSRCPPLATPQSWADLPTIVKQAQRGGLALG